MDYVLTMVINFKHHQKPEIIIERFATQAVAEAVRDMINQAAMCNTITHKVFWDIRKDK